MKVIAINGSPRKNGNTYTALEAMRPIFDENGIDFEILQLGNKPIYNCIACDECRGKSANKCIFEDDVLNEYTEKMAKADGVIFGAPVYYAGIAGGMKSFMDRAFRTNASSLAYKPVAALCSLRRSGGVATFDQMNHYFALSRSIVVPTAYWSAFHGSARGEVSQDIEAIYCAKEIAANMSWLLKVLDESKIEKPTPTSKVSMNFIR